jgi:hypothetical protein
MLAAFKKASWSSGRQLFPNPGWRMPGCPGRGKIGIMYEQPVIHPLRPIRAYTVAYRLNRQATLKRNEWAIRYLSHTDAA